MKPVKSKEQQKIEGVTVVAATDNRNKIKEIESITRIFGMSIMPKSQTVAADIDVEETGKTFEENSLIKARVIMEATGLTTIADDSGLSVDALDGAPGVYSARFAGEHGNDEKNNEKLLDLLKDVPDEKRTAKFVCVITMVRTDGKIISARGECKGRIGRSPAGAGGFGYDPLFIPDGGDLTFAQMRPDEKNKISHRARALESLKQRLESEGTRIG